MNVLVLGAEGIAGSALMRAIPDARGTTRQPSSTNRQVRPNVDVCHRGDLERAFDRAKPDVVVNCTGIVKSECDKHDPDHVRAVNASAPHVIAEIAGRALCRVIHLSTDCVFDGSRGGRLETDLVDATDLYGRTKAAGELVGYAHCLTLRTSFIGWDPRRGRGLLEWLRRPGHGSSEIAGYANALWSGLSAPELARVIACVVTRQKTLSGLYHVAGPVISKADLLAVLLGAHAHRVRRVDEPRLDRTLDGAKFQAIIGYVAPSWSDMATELGDVT